MIIEGIYVKSTKKFFIRGQEHTTSEDQGQNLYSDGGREYTIGNERRYIDIKNRYDVLLNLILKMVEFWNL